MSEELSTDSAISSNETNGFKVEQEDNKNAKRKLPAWMLLETQETISDSASTSSKKCKVAAQEDAVDSSLQSVNENDNVPAQIKEEPTEPLQNNDNEAKPSTSSVDAESTSSNNEVCKVTASTPEETASSSVQSESVNQAVNENDVAPVQIKKKPNEPLESADNEPHPSTTGIANPIDIKPSIKVEIADASSTTRISCKFGIRCYRRNPMHRSTEAHPGDSDYKRPDHPTPPDGTQACPYGNSCYRRNPIHFQHFSHPEDTDFKKNYKNYCLRQRRQKQQQQNTSNSSELDEYDLEDPFIDDGDDDYVPSSDDEDTEDILADYDDCDKVEE